MDQSFTNREWLAWLTRVRLLMIVLILEVGVVWPQYVPASAANHYFLPLVIFWITLGVLHLILVRWIPGAEWHGGLQVAGDVVIISALVYATGLQESSFISLYLLVIIVASILFSRRVAFATAALCLAFLGGMTALAYTGRIPRTFASLGTPESLRTWFLSNLFGFFAIFLGDDWQWQIGQAGTRLRSVSGGGLRTTGIGQCGCLANILLYIRHLL